MTPRLAALCAGAVLATAPLGDGGRGALSLFLHHTLLCLSCFVLAWRSPATLRHHRIALVSVGAFAVFTFLLSPNRYTTLLILADIAAALVVFWLASVAAADELAASRIVAAIAGGALIVTAVGVAEKLSSRPVHGLFANLNHAASLTAAATAVLLAAGSGGGSPARRRLALGAAAATFAFPLLAASKGGTIATVAGCLVVLGARRRRAAVALLLAVPLLAVALPTPLSARLLAGKSADPYLFERLRIWSSGLRMSADHALHGGVGLGAYGKVARRYNFPVEGAVARFGKVANVAHNEYLELLAEASLPGLALLLVPSLLAIRRAFAAIRQGGSGADLALASLGGLTALLCHALVESNLHAPANLYAFAALLAMAQPGLRAPPEPAGDIDDRGRAWPAGLAVVLAGLWLGAVLIPWLGDVAYRRYIRSGDPRALGRAMVLVPAHAGYRRAAGDAFELAFEARRSFEDLHRSREAHAQAARLDRLEPGHRARLAAIEKRAFFAGWPAVELAEMALQDFDAAARLDPTSPFLEVDRAALLAELGRAGAAVAALERAVALEPNCRIAQERLLELSRERGELEAAAAAAAALERIDGLRRRLGAAGTAYERRLLAAEGGDPTPLP